MTPPEPQTPDVVEDMKPWNGGDHAPGDWDGGAVLLRNGNTDTAAGNHDIAWQRGLGRGFEQVGAGADIIAYTPRREQPAIVGGVDREALFGALHALERLRDLTPGRANARDLADYHGSICAIAETALANFTPALTARPSAPAEVFDPAAIIALGHAMDEEDGGYPAPVEPGSEWKAEQIARRYGLLRGDITRQHQTLSAIREALARPAADDAK